MSGLLINIYRNPTDAAAALGIVFPDERLAPFEMERATYQHDLNNGRFWATAGFTCGTVAIVMTIAASLFLTFSFPPLAFTCALTLAGGTLLIALISFVAARKKFPDAVPPPFLLTVVDTGEQQRMQVEKTEKEHLLNKLQQLRTDQSQRIVDLTEQIRHEKISANEVSLIDQIEKLRVQLNASQISNRSKALEIERAETKIENLRKQLEEQAARLNPAPHSLAPPPPPEPAVISASIPPVARSSIAPLASSATSSTDSTTSSLLGELQQNPLFLRTQNPPKI